MPEQAPVKIIQTTLVHPKAVDQAITVLFVPLDGDASVAEMSEELRITLDEQLSADLRFPEQLAKFFELALEKAPKPDAPPPSDVDIGGPFSPRIEIYELSAAEYFSELLREPVIVIEQSPPTLASLGDLLKQSSGGAAIGAYIGFQIVTGPMLLIAVPAGMIICGAASGIAAGLQQWLRERIAGLQLRRRRKPRPSPTTPRGQTRFRSAGA